MHDRRVKTAERIRRVPFLCLLILFAGCTSLLPQNRATETPIQQRTITGIQAQSVDRSDQIIIRSTGRLDYSSVKQKTPLSILFIFPETQIGEVQREITPENSIITSVKTTVSDDNKNVRVEVSLNQDAPYDVEKNDTSLTITINKSGAPASEKSPVTQIPFPGKDTTFETPHAATVMPATHSKTFNSEPINTGKPSIIRQLDFSAQKSGKSSIIIGTTYSIRHEISKIAAQRLQLRLFDTRLPQFREHRPLITTRFDSAVDRVTPVQELGKEDVVDIIVELREEVPYEVEKNGTQLVMHFEPSSIGPRPLSAANLPDWKQVLEDSVDQTPLTGKPGVPKKESEKNVYESYFGPKKEYTGQKIALDFYETNIKNVFRILQQISGKNYAIDPNVGGKVTISMEKPVPWDQVLDLILKTNNLGMEERGDILRIATLQTLNQEEQARQQQIQAMKKRQEQEKELEPLITEYIPVNYANAQKEIIPHIKGMLTEKRGKASVDQRNNQIIITDVREKLEKAKQIIGQIDKVTPQVVIEARIVEVNDSFTRDIGTEWAAVSEDVYRDDLDGLYGYNVAMNHPAASTSSLGFEFTRLPNMGTPLVLNARLTAMEQNGQGKIISSPKIVTADNKKAMIKQGFEYPYQTVEGDDVQINFKSIDLTLEVTPHVTPDSRIALQIFVTKNDIADITDTGEPALSTNEARTELLVEDGNTIVIGGIMKKTINTSESGFPILKEIPLIGWLFKSRSNISENKELLIFMTPRIVQLEQRSMSGLENENFE